MNSSLTFTGVDNELLKFKIKIIKITNLSLKNNFEVKNYIAIRQ